MIISDRINPRASGAFAPVPPVPPGGFHYLSLVRRYTRPESYSRAACYRPRGWNVAPPLHGASPVYLRRIFGGADSLPGARACRAEHTAVARAYLRAYRRACKVRSARAERFASLYGRDGYLVAGGFLSTWPETARESMRDASTRCTAYLDAALTHWRAAGRASRTFRRERERIAS